MFYYDWLDFLVVVLQMYSTSSSCDNIDLLMPLQRKEWFRGKQKVSESEGCIADFVQKPAVIVIFGMLSIFV